LLDIIKDSGADAKGVQLQALSFADFRVRYCNAFSDRGALFLLSRWHGEI
jgi:hypothetical protein